MAQLPSVWTDCRGVANSHLSTFTIRLNFTFQCSLTDPVTHGIDCLFFVIRKSMDSVLQTCAGVRGSLVTAVVDDAVKSSTFCCSFSQIFS